MASSAASQELRSLDNTARASLDSQRSTSTSSPPSRATTNGVHHVHPVPDDEPGSVAALQAELKRTREEKDALAAQYHNLLAKLTNMRTTLGNKLKQDAEELDRREQQIQQLSAQNEDLESTVTTLRDELVTSNAEGQRAADELDALRARSFQESTHESLRRERELREAQMELERCRMERDEWERAALQERVRGEGLDSMVESMQHDLELEREAREREADELQRERENATNLQSVLQDFQAAKDHELRQAVKDHESQLLQATQSLAEFKHRALTAEVELEESRATTARTAELEKEVKEKTALISKLRHEAVIINEHLMEALRRLRRSSTSTNVDRRLVTNVLISFLTTPRQDAKRFEMLGLLATILSWTDAERTRAGLQRTAATGIAPVSAPSFWGRRSTSASSTTIDQTDETESFSRLWVEFLLTEAEGGRFVDSEAGGGVRRLSSSSSRPMSPPYPVRTGSLASLGLGMPNSRAAMASTPNLSLSLLSGSPKGKEREHTFSIDGSVDEAHEDEHGENV